MHIIVFEKYKEEYTTLLCHSTNEQIYKLRGKL